MKKNLITLIIILFGLTILFLFFAFVLSSKKIETQTYPLIKIPAKSAEREAILSFSENYLEVLKGKEFNLDIKLETKKDVYGVDVFLEYDPSLIELKSLKANSEVGNLVEPSFGKEQEPGKLYFSILAPATETFTGDIKLATLKFLTKQLGATEVKFNLDKSNVADSQAKDILREVKNAKINIIAN